jgi:type IV secretory pathway TraG/TraD family ATPase VirD4
MSLGLVLKSLADPRVLDLVCPGDGEGLDVEAFVRRGTDRLYLVSEGGAGVCTAPLVTAFASAVVSAARRHSQTRPGGRLDPPLTLVLDEAANVAPLPDLPMLMSDGGGRGMSTWVFVQSFAQLRARWGRDGADTIWGASCAKILLGGCTEADDLERISRVIGDRWARRHSHTSRSGLLPHADSSTSTSRERERILRVQDLARLPLGTALLLYRSVAPALISLPAWWERPDATQFKTSQASAIRPHRELAHD